MHVDPNNTSVHFNLFDSKDFKISSSFFGEGRTVELQDSQGVKHKLSMDQFMEFAKNEIKSLNERALKQPNSQGKDSDIKNATDIFRIVTELNEQSQNFILILFSKLGLTKGYKNRYEQIDQIKKELIIPKKEYENQLDSLAKQIEETKNHLGNKGSLWVFFASEGKKTDDELRNKLEVLTKDKELLEVKYLTSWGKEAVRDLQKAIDNVSDEISRLGVTYDVRKARERISQLQTRKEETIEKMNKLNLNYKV